MTKLSNVLWYKMEKVDASHSSLYKNIHQHQSIRIQLQKSKSRESDSSSPRSYWRKAGAFWDEPGCLFSKIIQHIFTDHHYVFCEKPGEQDIKTEAICGQDAQRQPSNVHICKPLCVNRAIRAKLAGWGCKERTGRLRQRSPGWRSQGRLVGKIGSRPPLVC